LNSLEGALACLAAGWRVFPVHGIVDGRCTCGDEKCKSQGKHPLFNRWQTIVADEAEVRSWFARAPGINFGIATGAASGIMVLDVDPKNGGMESLAALEREHGPLPETAAVRTGSGGIHAIFRHVAGVRNSGSRIASGIDIRGEGGFIVGPGSLHLSGERYAVLVDADPSDAPAWLVTAAIAKSRRPREDARPWSPVDHGPLLPSVREFAKKMVDRRRPGVEGKGGGVAMLHLCRDVFRGLGLPDDEATREILASYWSRCEPPWEDEAQIEHKIDQGKDDEGLDGRPVGYLLHEYRIQRALDEAPAAAPDTAAVQSANPDRLRIVRLTHKEADVADEVLECMAARNGVYARYDQLVAVMPGELPGEKKRLVPLARSIVRGLISRCCELEKYDARAKDWVGANPPTWLVDQIYDRVHWPGVPPITDFTDAPVLNLDGEVVEPGYDRSSGVYYAPSFAPLPLPERPTREDARAAAERVLDLLCDFPLVERAYLSAWLAACLTQFCRTRIRGPIPMFLIDGNVRASGKTNLVDMACQIALGHKASKTPEAKDPDEFRKQFSSAVMAGDTVTCFDNLTGAVGGAALDAALTNDGRWSDRLLGTNKRVDKVVRMTVFATGNNIPLRDDLVRRVLYIRLQSADEQPWLRDSSKFKYDLSGERDGKPHILAHRAELVRDLLTILRAYVVAGSPPVQMESWGSFESWSREVRAPIVWLGLPDPADGRRQLSDEVDEEPSHIAQLMTGLERVQKDSPEGFTSAQVAAACATFMPDDRNDALKEAVAALAFVRPGAAPTGRQVGHLLKKLRDRPVGGRQISRARFLGHDKIILWLVQPVKSASV
jgi:hypothetical protein